jgi:hypothetical protein
LLLSPVDALLLLPGLSPCVLLQAAKLSSIASARTMDKIFFI